MSDANRESGNPTGILEGYSPAKPYSPDIEERKRVGHVLQKFTRADEHRRPYEHNWEFYKLYLQGNQLVGKDLTTGQMVRVSLRPEDVRRLLSIENLLRPAARACIGKLSRIIPAWDVLPRTDDQHELRAAAVATSFLDYIGIKESLRVKFLRAQRTLMWCGTSVFQLCWDRNAGQTVAWCKECGYQGEESEIKSPCPQCTMQFEQEAQQSQMLREQAVQQLGQIAQAHGTPPPEPPPQAQQKQAAPLVKASEGDIVVDKLDTREFFPEPGVSDPKNLRWVILRKAIPVSEARESFPEMAAYISSETGIYIDRSIMYYGNLANAKTETSYLQDHVYHYEAHEVPSAQFPEGRITHIINNMEVKVTPNYYYKLLKRLPFYFQWFEKNDGDLWGEAPIAQSWHMQRERNRLRTQIREHRELTLRPKLLKPQKTKLGVDEIDTTPGQILEYNNFAGKPSWLELPQLPVYAYEDLDRMDQSIRLQFGVTEQEMNQTSGDQSGRFAAILEAQSSESISPIIVENTDEWKELGRGILVLGQRYYPPERMWTVNGRERVRTGNFAQANLSPGWDITIAETDSLSKNPALRQQQAREYLQDGVFTDPRTGVPDMRMYMRVAGLKLPGSGPDVTSAEHAYASQVPEMMMRGEPFAPRPWDDAQIMVEELVGWLRGPGRNAQPQMQDAIGQIYLYYLSLMPQYPSNLSISGTPGIGMQQGGQQQQGQQQGQPAGLGPGPLPGSPGTNGGPGPQPVQQGTVPQQAAQLVQKADRQGERAARGSQPHEG